MRLLHALRVYSNDLADDELLNVPLANLLPGELRRAFQVQAIAAEKKQETEIEHVRSTSLLQQKAEEEEEKDHEHAELARREEILLAGIRDRERDIIKEAEVLDRRTIKLTDGRRAYVDGDRYRDAEGRELHGADRALAEQLHLEQPDAATWQEHQDIERSWQATERLKQKVERLQSQGGTEDDKTLTGYEAEYASRLAPREKESPTVPDYGSGDYMTALGLSGNFRQATTAQPVAAVLPAQSPSAPRSPNLLQPR